MVRIHQGRPVYNFVDIASIAVAHIKNELFKFIPFLKSLRQYKGSAAYMHTMGSFVYHEQSVLVVQLTGGRRLYKVGVSIDKDKLVIEQSGTGIVTFYKTETLIIELADPLVFTKAIEIITSSINHFWKVSLNHNLFGYAPSSLDL